MIGTISMYRSGSSGSVVKSIKNPTYTFPPSTLTMTGFFSSVRQRNKKISDGGDVGDSFSTKFCAASKSCRPHVATVATKGDAAMATTHNPEFAKTKCELHQRVTAEAPSHGAHAGRIPME